jgi:hypothetical protein
LSDTLVKHELDHEDVHEVSVGLINALMEHEVSPELAIAGLALSLGRFMSPQVLEADNEVSFVQDLSEWISMYFMETGEQVN